jgi:S-(hydroxymethyl)glutathione dehydrogenase/alcohol dehydrogenase
MKTEAAILIKTGQPLVLAELDIPPLKPGQVLVEVAYSGACGTQVMEVHGFKGEDRWLPHCLGHEGSGTVLDVGSAVTKVKPGDQVVLSWIKGSGVEAGGTVYNWDGKHVNAGGITTFQRHTVASENRLTVIPERLPMDVAVLLGCAVPTGMGAVFNVTQVKAGESVAVFGTGGIGLSACLGAAFSGAIPVIGVDPNASRRELAMKYGATHVIDPMSADVIAQINELVPGGVDVAIEATGIPEVMDQAVNSTRMQGGRAVVIGNARIGQKLSVDPTVFNHGKSLMGTWGGNSVPDRDYLRFARLLGSGRFPVNALFSKPYGLNEANAAIHDLETGRVGRPLIDMSLG